MESLCVVFKTPKNVGRSNLEDKTSNISKTTDVLRCRTKHQENKKIPRRLIFKFLVENPSSTKGSAISKEPGKIGNW